MTFVGYEHVYGIPEHADSLALKSTVYVISIVYYIYIEILLLVKLYIHSIIQ